MSKEEIEEGKAHLKWLSDNGILSSEDERHIENVLNYIEQLENKLKESEEIKDKYLQKLVDALVVKKDLSPEKNNEFKKIIADNIDLTTLELRIKLTEEF